MFKYTPIASPSYMQPDVAELNAIIKPWNGLKLSVLGDSVSTYPGWIPANYGCYYNINKIPYVDSMWWKQLCDITGAEPLVIEAWGGSCVAEYDSANGSGSSSTTPTVDDSRCKNLHAGSGNSRVDPDIICIAMGVNDYGTNVPLGAWDGHVTLDTTDTKTWRGAYANMLLKIHNEYPKALVFCFSPWFCIRANTTYVNKNAIGNTYQDYEDAMREVCELLQCVYIDTNNIGLSRYNYGPIFADDYNSTTGVAIHPNAKGQEILGQCIAAEIRHRAIGYVNWQKGGSK